MIGPIWLGPGGSPPPDEAKIQATYERLVAAMQERVMHYKNGREAKNGDKVVLVDGYGAPKVGILYDATAGNDYCNGKLAIISGQDPCPNLAECLHWDDVKIVLGGTRTTPPA